MTHTSTEQPEALRLAELLENKVRGGAHPNHWVFLREGATELRRLHASVQELQDQLANAHQSSGAEAYDIACEEMEAYQCKRAQAGKEVGCTGSLVDGMGWVYDRLEELEASQARVPLSDEQITGFDRYVAGTVHGRFARAKALVRMVEAKHGITQEKQG